MGDITVRGARDYSMRIWIDPNKAAARGLTADDITTALKRAQPGHRRRRRRARRRSAPARRPPTSYSVQTESGGC